jgi:hypothetical protein
MKLLPALLLVLAVPLAACAGGSSSDDGADDTPSDSNDSPGDDSSTDDSAGDDSSTDDSSGDDSSGGDGPDAGGDPGACDTPSSFAGGALGEPLAQRGDQGEKLPANVYSVGGLLDASESPDVLQIELWDNYGAFAGGAVTPGTYTLAGAELTIESCGVCVSLFADIASETGRGYFATGGTVTIDSLSPNLKGSVANLTLVEWDVNTDAPVANGCSTAIPAATFDAVVEQVSRP